MYARGAHSLEDILPGGWTLRSGDGAEELTSGVATKATPEVNLQVSPDPEHRLAGCVVHRAPNHFLPPFVYQHQPVCRIQKKSIPKLVVV